MKKLATMTGVTVLVVAAMAGPSLAQEMEARQHAHDHDARHHDHHRRGHFVHGPVIYWTYPAYVPPTTTYVVPVGGYW